MLSASHYRDPEAFLKRAGPRLREEEIRYGLILGVCSRVARDPHEYGAEDPWFLSLEEAGEVVALTLRTPPYDVLVAAFSGDPLVLSETLVEQVSRVFPSVPGVVGEPDIADAFARAWCDVRAVEIAQTMKQRIYDLTSVRPIPISPGRMRQASMEDIELVTDWAAGFHRDTFGLSEPELIRGRTAKMIERGEVYFWEDGDAVSMAAKSRPTGDVITVGMVYTPPEYRKRGYASSCVATLSELLLKSGYRHCTLYTDLANPTSNRIYKRIGYTEVCDSVNHKFSKASGDED